MRFPDSIQGSLDSDCTWRSWIGHLSIGYSAESLQPLERGQMVSTLIFTTFHWRWSVPMH